MSFLDHIHRDDPPLVIAAPVSCSKCGNLCTCTCEIARDHQPYCRYRRAAELGIELECEHGAQACPICDPCTCGSPAILKTVL